MATFSRIKQWVSNEVLTAADLNAEFDNLLNNMTPTGIEDASANVAAMQASTSPGGLGTESLATSLLGEIQRIRYVLKRMVNIGLSQEWYETPGRSWADLMIVAADLEAQSVETAALKDLNVTTGKIADAAVTRPKLAAVGQQLSSSSGSFTTTNTTDTDVTNLSVTITTTGRPLTMKLVSAVDGTSQVAAIRVSHATSGICRGNLTFYRGTTAMACQAFQDGESSSIWLPPSAFQHTEIGLAADTYTIKVAVRLGGLTTPGSLGVEHVKLLVYEEA